MDINFIPLKLIENTNTKISDKCLAETIFFSPLTT